MLVRAAIHSMRRSEAGASSGCGVQLASTAVSPDAVLFFFLSRRLRASSRSIFFVRHLTQQSQGVPRQPAVQPSG